MLRNAVGGGGGMSIFHEKTYEGIQFTMLLALRGWVGVKFAEKSVM